MINKILKHLLIYILLYGIYIGVSGLKSSGGGFPAGAIFASSFIGYDLIHSKKISYYKIKILNLISVVGVVTYILIGISSMMYGFNFLYLRVNDMKFISYYIDIIELAISIVISTVMINIYLCLRE